MIQPHRETRVANPKVSELDNRPDSDDDLETDLEQPDNESDASKSLLISQSHDANPRRQPRRNHRHLSASRPVLLAIVLISMLLGALATLAITAATAHLRAAHRNENTLASSSHDAPATFRLTAPCGDTPAEARAAGCVFDLISFNWLPPACHDEVLARHFEKELADAGQLSWYEDPERSRPLTRTQIMTGEHSGIYVSLAYHLRHCTAMWRRMHRALLEGGGGLGRVDSYIWSYHHTLHCEETLLTRFNGTDVGAVFTTEVRIKYPDCGVVL